MRSPGTLWAHLDLSQRKRKREREHEGEREREKEREIYTHFTKHFVVMKKKRDIVALCMFTYIYKTQKNTQHHHWLKVHSVVFVTTN